MPIADQVDNLLKEIEALTQQLTDDLDNDEWLVISRQITPLTRKLNQLVQESLDPANEKSPAPAATGNEGNEDSGKPLMNNPTAHRGRRPLVRVTLAGGSTFTGKNADTIIRREFGRRAWIKWGRTATGVEFGDILIPSEYTDHAHHHVGRVLYVEEVD